MGSLVLMGVDMPETYAGQFLVATPLIAAPPFARTVVLLLEHDESGAIGLILNDPTELLAEDHLPEIAGHLTGPPRVFLGGPVSTDTAISLGCGKEIEYLRPSALPGIGIVDIEQSLNGIEKLRLFAGYAGWEPHQLEAEVREGAWWVLFPDLVEIFTSDPSGMWERTLERGPGALPLYATYPPDPSEN
jgi:putative transcriptional regulator